ncbi:M24 family metallopeptidase [Candidatus Formimonas warabiya]|uniref:Ectoine hydrolase DoeA n=1 Tax=Formimonas warabiya TaxID=1761012 RepID=A0A3G1KX60_FORW1|nr:Xaa-Pro peptidase family protein [Candidatus Formimonas warabiya]ATW27046.1 ectoine hydrolase DoeA [Candidatus Formimonas warabiya]
MLAFEKTEYMARVNQTKEQMAAKGMDVLLVTDPANMCYLSGYDALSFYTPQAVVVSTQQDQPVWIGRFQDLVCAQETCWMDQGNFIAYPDYYLWEPTEKHVMDFVADFLKGKGLAGSVMGVEMDAYYFTAFWFERLKKDLPNAGFLDATLLVNRIRAVKSPQEIVYMKKAAAILEKGMQRAVDVINEGVRECDAAAEIYHDLISGTASAGGDYPSLAPIMPSGKRTGGAHLTWTEEKYQKDQIVYVEFAGCYKRYHAPMARTIYIGNPPPEIEETAKVVVEGLNMAMETAKPGATCEEIERAWKSVITKYGIEKESRMGYDIGLSYPPVWMQHTMHMRPGDKSVLKPNMTFHLMPGVWRGDFGVAITESIRITENGCETLAAFPRKLFVK